MSRRRGKGGGAAKTLIGAVLIAVAFAALGALTFFSLASRPPPLDEATLCRTDAPIQAHTIIVVDATDRLERRHRERLRRVALQERARLSQYDRMTLLRIDARNPQEPRRLFSKCLPKPPEDANFFTDNPRQVAAQWDEDFANALSQALGRAASGRGQRASPILAGVRAAAADLDFGADVPTRRLVIVSDFLEHDPSGFSLYAEDVAYEAWAERDVLGPPLLTGVAVRLSPLDRPDYAALQQAALTHFWPDYFEAAESESVNIDPSY